MANNTTTVPQNANDLEAGTKKGDATEATDAAGELSDEALAGVSGGIAGAFSTKTMGGAGAPDNSTGAGSS
ncbi:MAG: hypothetical protein U0353_15075 [Sandaracinus sp.]